jgi:hypothetical protein
VWALPSNAIGFQGRQNNDVCLEIDGKPVRTPVIIGPSDNNNTEVLKKWVSGSSAQVPDLNTNAWPTLDGTERVLVGNLDVLDEQQKAAAKPSMGP